MAIVNLISDYQLALFSYIKIWENFSNNNTNSKSPFRPNKNDLIDSFILFSIVPQDNILLVTDEKRIHSIIKEVGKPNSVISLTNYLSEIKLLLSRISRQEAHAANIGIAKSMADVHFISFCSLIIFARACRTLMNFCT